MEQKKQLVNYSRRVKVKTQVRHHCKSCKAIFDEGYAEPILKIMLKKGECYDCCFKHSDPPTYRHESEGKGQLSK